MSNRSYQVVSNLEALERFWRRSPFHDRSIEEVAAINKRVLIRVQDLTLVITGVTRLDRCEVPTVWLSEKLTSLKSGLAIEITTESGVMRVMGDDLRLIRNDDLSMLIPWIDA